MNLFTDFITVVVAVAGTVHAFEHQVSTSKRQLHSVQPPDKSDTMFDLKKPEDIVKCLKKLSNDYAVKLIDEKLLLTQILILDTKFNDICEEKFLLYEKSLAEQENTVYTLYSALDGDLIQQFDDCLKGFSLTRIGKKKRDRFLPPINLSDRKLPSFFKIDPRFQLRGLYQRCSNDLYFEEKLLFYYNYSRGIKGFAYTKDFMESSRDLYLNLKNIFDKKNNLCQDNLSQIFEYICNYSDYSLLGLYKDVTLFLNENPVHG